MGRYHRPMKHAHKEAPDLERFLETADVARVRGVMPATIRIDVQAGLLKVAALTVRGTRLFRPKDVARYRSYRLRGGRRRRQIE